MSRHVLAIAVALLIAGCSQSPAPLADLATIAPLGSSASVSGEGTATVDGVLSPGEWAGAARFDFPVTVPPRDGGGTVAGTLYLMNDTERLHAALVLARPAYGGAISFALEFDRDADGVQRPGDDVLVVNVGQYTPVELWDDFRWSCPEADPCSAGCSSLDTAPYFGQPAGSIEGGVAASSNGTQVVVELWRPLRSGDLQRDMALAPGWSTGVQASVRLFSLEVACNYGSECMTDTRYPAWGEITYLASGTPAPEPWGGTWPAGLPACGGRAGGAGTPPGGEEPPSVLEVAIDLKPCDELPTINLASRGTTAVAILSGAAFDARDVDPATVRLEGAPVAVKPNGTPMASEEDSDGDGLLDLVLHVRTQDFTTLPVGDVSADLAGTTFAGQAIHGSHPVRIIRQPDR